MKSLYLFLLIVIVSSCGDQRCIDADDFGFPYFRIPARYTVDQIYGSEDDQVVPWIETSVVTSGNPMFIVVPGWQYDNTNNKSQYVSAFCPWFGNLYSQTGIGGKLVNECARMEKCIIKEPCYGNRSSLDISNAPCLIDKGMGLFGLLVSEGENPNLNEYSMRDPIGDVFHIGDPKAEYKTKTYTIDKKGKLVEAIGYLYKKNESFAGKRLYMKILDKYYQDNSGQYITIVKSGYYDEQSNFLDHLQKMLMSGLFGDNNSDGAIKAIYNGIIKNKSYQNIVGILLTLYVTITGASFMIGILKISQYDFFVRIGKISLIAVLISEENSWDFFNNNVFAIFIQGSEFVKKILLDSSISGSGQGDIVNMLISPQTLFRISSMVFTGMFGLFYAIAYIIAIGVILIIIFKSYAVYLTSMVMLGMTICSFPLLIVFMLFDNLKSITIQMINYMKYWVIQSVFLFIGIAFLSVMIREQLYKGLGFPICKISLFAMPDFETFFNPGGSEDYDPEDRSVISWWAPKISNKTQREDIAIPHSFKDKNSKECMPYECSGSRYPDLPFLDPDNLYDKRRIDGLRSQDYTVFIPDFLILILATFVLSRYIEAIKAMSRMMAGDMQPPMVDTKSIAAGTMSGIASNLLVGAAHAGHAIDALVDKHGSKELKIFKDRSKAIIHKIQTMSNDFDDITDRLDINKIIDKKLKKIENFHTDKENREVIEILKDGLDQATINQIEEEGRRNGLKLDYNKLNFDSETDLKKAVKEVLRNENIYRDIDVTNRKELVDAIASKRFHTQYKFLSIEEKKIINDILDKPIKTESHRVNLATYLGVDPNSAGSNELKLMTKEQVLESKINIERKAIMKQINNDLYTKYSESRIYEDDVKSKIETLNERFHKEQDPVRSNKIINEIKSLNENLEANKLEREKIEIEYGNLYKTADTYAQNKADKYKDQIDVFFKKSDKVTISDLYKQHDHLKAYAKITRKVLST